MYMYVFIQILKAIHKGLITNTKARNLNHRLRVRQLWPAFTKQVLYLHMEGPIFI